MDINLNPFIRVAWDSWLDEDFTIGPRVIFDYEIIYLEAGEMDVTVNNTVYHAVPGDIICLRPKQTHTLRGTRCGKVHQPHIHFDLVRDASSLYVYISFADLPEIDPKEYGLFRRDLLLDNDIELPTLIRLKNSSGIAGLLMEIIGEFNDRRVYSEFMINGLFQQMFTLLLRSVAANSIDQRNGDGRDVVSQVREYINDNLHRDISLDEISEATHVSKYYLCRMFKQTYGTSPMQYHMDQRISLAKVLLVTTHQSISLIAEQLGFPSIYSFSRAFKKREYVAPSVYRK